MIGRWCILLPMLLSPEYWQSLLESASALHALAARHQPCNHLCCCDTERAPSCHSRYQYTGYEAGHVPECRYNSQEHQLSYGVPALA